MAKRPKTQPARIRFDCIELAKEIAKVRDGYTCQRCGKNDQQTKIDGSHVIAVGICGGRLACDPWNIKALCGRPCHGDWWSGNPVEAGEWFQDKFPERWAYLQAEYREHLKDPGTIYMPEWHEIHASLKEMQATGNLKDIRAKRS